MITNVFNDIESIYKKGNIKYMLNKYIDRDYWNSKFNTYFSNNIENLTDFNYSLCFNMYINISDIEAKTGMKEFNDFIINNRNAYRVQIQISAVAPYSTLRFIKYEYDGEKIRFFSKSTPFLREHLAVLNKVNEFFSEFNLTLLSDEVLSLEVADVSLELREENVTVYNCLFEDEY